jgi:hypothetical protein
VRDLKPALPPPLRFTCVIMFIPRRIDRVVSQKQRGRCHGGLSLLSFNPGSGKGGGHGIFSRAQHVLGAISSGFLHPRCLESMFIYARKLFKVPQKSTKIWINLHACHLVTRKALNVRMGKGKGSRIGLNIRVRAGSSVVAINHCRLGLWHKLTRFIRVRCSFRVCAVISGVGSRGGEFSILQGRKGSFSFIGDNTKTRSMVLLQKRYITDKILEVLGTLQKLGYLQSYIYFKELFFYYRRYNLKLTTFSTMLINLQIIWVLRFGGGVMDGLAMGRIGVLLFRFFKKISAGSVRTLLLKLRFFNKRLRLENKVKGVIRRGGIVNKKYRFLIPKLTQKRRRRVG